GTVGGAPLDAGAPGSAAAGFSTGAVRTGQTFVVPVTATWRALQDSAGSASHTQMLWTVPPATKITRLVSRVTQGFGGAGSDITGVALECGYAGATSAYLDSQSVWAPDPAPASC